MGSAVRHLLYFDRVVEELWVAEEHHARRRGGGRAVEHRALVT